jgi:hypothetical protein
MEKFIKEFINDYALRAGITTKSTVKDVTKMLTDVTEDLTNMITERINKISVSELLEWLPNNHEHNIEKCDTEAHMQPEEVTATIYELTNGKDMSNTKMHTRKSHGRISNGHITETYPMYKSLEYISHNVKKEFIYKCRVLETYTEHKRDMNFPELYFVINPNHSKKERAKIVRHTYTQDVKTSVPKELKDLHKNWAAHASVAAVYKLKKS